MATKRQGEEGKSFPEAAGASVENAAPLVFLGNSREAEHHLSSSLRVEGFLRKSFHSRQEEMEMLYVTHGSVCHMTKRACGATGKA